jgi:succinoglycan biosynthesis protein ExoO
MSVSVVIPAYNAADCIERAIHSALGQSLSPLEIIVVDDASIDATFDLVSRLSRNERRIKLLRQPINTGPAAARNLGIRSAIGDWIAILDADDAFLDDRLRYLVEAAECRNLTFAADNMSCYDVGAQCTVGPAIDPALIGSCLILDRYTFLRNCAEKRPGSIDFGLLQPIMWRAFLTSSGVSYPEECRHGEDFIFYLRALLAGAKFALFPEPLYLWSQRVGSISHKRSNLSQTVSNYRLMERQTLELVREPIIRADPMLCSLLVVRAEKIKAIYTRHELHDEFRDLLRKRDFIQLALQILRSNEMRRFAFRALRRELFKRITTHEAGL